MTGPLQRLRSVEDDPSDVQRLLARLPDPGPMPSQLAARIQASLAEEQGRRVPDGATVYSLDDAGARRGPTTRFLLAMSGAAAAAALVGAVAVHGLTSRHDVSVIANVAHQPSASVPPAESAGGDVVVEVSSTRYHAATLQRDAAAAFARPATPFHAQGDAAARIGPLATAAGVHSCVAALGLTGVEHSRVDIAVVDERPAAVLFTTAHGKTEARVVDRSCGGAQSRVVNGPVSLD